MDLKNRIKVLWKSAGLSALLLSGMAYGLILSSISETIYFFQGNVLFVDLLLQFVTSTLAYTSIFLVVIVLVVVSSSIKTYLSIGMDRWSVAAIWSDVVIFVTGFVTFSIMMIILIWSKVDEATIFSRVLNIQFPIRNIMDYGKIFVLALAMVGCITMLFSLIGNVGNKFGGLICASLCIFIVEVIFLSMSVIINLFVWGDYFAGIVIVLMIFDGFLYWTNRKMIMKTEVMR